MPLSLAFIAEGNAETPDCWSGVGQGIVTALRRAGADVHVLDAELRGWRRAAALATAVHPDRTRWRQRYALGRGGFHARSAWASRLLRNAGRRFDVVIQAGATFRIAPDALAGARSVVYADANVRFARRAAGFAGASLLESSVAEACAAREAEVYRGADRIWTMSGAAAASFRDDFGVDAGRICVIGGGANVRPEDAPPAATSSDAAPVVLFVGKDHRRKGSDVLLDAWPRVREQVPNAELHFVGCEPPRALAMAGVVAHGFVSRREPAGAARLAGLYARASLFCLPSRYEPFGQVFIEAMLSGLACIGTDRWAMPEFITPGETGWLVADGDASALAGALVDALRDPARTRAMGARARDVARARFTWDHVAARALADLQSPAGSPADSMPAGAAPSRA